VSVDGSSQSAKNYALDDVLDSLSNESYDLSAEEDKAKAVSKYILRQDIPRQEYMGVNFEYEMGESQERSMEVTDAPRNTK
jgi:hypothetical protein